MQYGKALVLALGLTASVVSAADGQWLTCTMTGNCPAAPKPAQKTATQPSRDTMKTKLADSLASKPPAVAQSQTQSQAQQTNTDTAAKTAAGTTAPSTQSRVTTSQVRQSGSASGLPFLTKPLTKPSDRETLARLMEVGGTVSGVGLYTHRDSVLVAWKRAYPDLGIETRASLAEHIRSLEVITCPQVPTNLAWVKLPSKGVVLTGWRRTLGTGAHRGELCLLNREKARIEASLGCGNIITGLPWGQVAVVTPPPQIQYTAGPQGPQGPPGIQGPMGPQGPQGPPGEAVEIKSRRRIWPWVALAAVGAGVGGYCAWRDSQGRYCDGSPYPRDRITAININSNSNKSFIVGSGRFGIRLSGMRP